MNFTSGLLPNRATLDPITALYVLERVIGRTLKIEFANPGMDMSDETLQKLSAKGVFTIGIGKNRTHKDREVQGKLFGSEAALMIHELRSIGLLSQDNILDTFTEMLDRDNTNGHLKRQPYSGYWIVQQAYRLGRHGQEEIITDEEIVRHGMHLVSVYVQASKSKVRPSLALRKHIMNSPAMQFLPEQGAARTHQGPLTVSRYIRDMYICKIDEQDIVERTKWFVAVHDWAKKQQQMADHTAESQGFRTFSVGKYKDAGVWVESDSPYLLSAVARRHDLVVMRSSRGNIIIMSKMFNLAMVAEILQHAEPDGRWHYAPDPLNVLANGTESHDEIESTNFSREEVELVVSMLGSRKF